MSLRTDIYRTLLFIVAGILLIILRHSEQYQYALFFGFPEIMFDIIGGMLLLLLLFLLVSLASAINSRFNDNKSQTMRPIIMLLIPVIGTILFYFKTPSIIGLSTPLNEVVVFRLGMLGVIIASIAWVFKPD
jgi:hypothetical protein